jgi:AraC-like DNA-binding protein
MLLQRRAEHAKILVGQGQSLAQVALECGFPIKVN